MKKFFVFGLLVLFILASVALVFLGDLFNSGNKTDNTEAACNGRAERLVIKEKGFSDARYCFEEPALFESEQATLVRLEYGEPMDCPSGCIVNRFFGVVYKDKIISMGDIGNFPIPGSVSIVLSDKYGDECYFGRDLLDWNDNPTVSLGVTKVDSEIINYSEKVTTSMGVGSDTLGDKTQDPDYRWKIVFDNHSNQNKTCTLNGSLVLTTMVPGTRYLGYVYFDELEVVR